MKNTEYLDTEHLDIDGVEMALMLISIDIGQIHECNSRFTNGLARIIWELGKPIEELTIKEFIHICKQYNDVFNRIDRALLTD